MAVAKLEGTRSLEATMHFLGLPSSEKRFLQQQGGTRCFPGATRVLTASGHKRIDKIAVGDYVVSDMGGELVEKPVVRVYRYEEGQHCTKTIRFVLCGGASITCTPSHEILYRSPEGEEAYVAAGVIAARVLESRGGRKQICGVEYGTDRFFELQEQWASGSDATSGNAGIHEDDVANGRWALFDSQDAQAGGVGVLRESRGQAAGASHQPQPVRQQGGEPYVGDEAREHRLYACCGQAVDEQRCKERDVQAGCRCRARHQGSLRAVCHDGEGLGGGVRGVNSRREGHFAGSYLEARPLTDADISWVEYGGEHEAVYDLSVMDTHNYVVSDANIIVHNSGKTYGIAQALNVLVQSLVREIPPGETFRISIMRKRFPSLRGTAMRDFFEIMQKYGWYNDKYHNKTENEYNIGPVQVEFLSLDDPQKIRGRKRDIAWLNEANEFTFEDFKQINLRTTQKVILDYNPSDEYHWIYDNIEPRPETLFVKTTYKDNPFLSPEIIKEIEWLKQVDANAWRVYGQGERGASGVNIYPTFEVTKDWPEEADCAYGLDFGHNNPSSLVKVAITEDDEYGKRLWVRQLMYEKKLTTQDIISRLEKIIDKSWEPIYGDSSSPDRIDAIFRAGFNVKGADKRNYSVKDGIDFCKQHRIMVHEDSEDLIREIRGYKWRTDNNDRVLDEPVKFMDHALDAMRYAAYTHFANPITWLMA